MPTTFTPSGLPGSVPITGAPLMLSMPLLTQGKLLFVDNTHARARNAPSHGTIDRPFTTGAYALERATASNGDTIIVIDGHTETLAALMALTTKVGVGFYHTGTGAAWKTGASNGINGSSGPQQVKRPAALLPASTVGTIFTVTGACKITDIWGLVEVVLPATANLLKISADATGAPAAVDLCAASADLTGAAALTVLSVTGTVANAMVVSANQTRIAQAGHLIVHAGIITITTTGTMATGTVSWHVNYQPLTPGSGIVAA